MLGYKLAGFLSEARLKPGREIIPGARLLGPVSRLETLCRAHGVQDIIALPGLARDRLGRLMECYKRLTETIQIIPDFGSLLLVGAESDSWGRRAFAGRSPKPGQTLEHVD